MQTQHCNNMTANDGKSGRVSELVVFLPEGKAVLLYLVGDSHGRSTAWPR